MPAFASPEGLRMNLERERIQIRGEVIGITSPLTIIYYKQNFQFVKDRFKSKIILPKHFSGRRRYVAKIQSGVGTSVPSIS